MNFALFRCCTTPIFLRQYETSTDAVLKAFGVGLTDIREFNCCGYPLKNTSYKGYLLSAARNLSLAEKRNLDIVTICNCCYGSLKYAHQVMVEDGPGRREVNGFLGKEGLEYGGGVQVRHVLDILHTEIGLQNIRKRIKRVFNGLKIALHYGCHLLRPWQVARFDRRGVPAKFDELLEVTGAESIAWPRKFECCGSPLWGIDDELSLDLTEKKIRDAVSQGANALCVACPYCQLQFDRVQRILLERRGLEAALPSLLYTQLLGLSLGIGEESLGIGLNELDGRSIMGFLM